MDYKEYLLSLSSGNIAPLSKEKGSGYIDLDTDIDALLNLTLESVIAPRYRVFVVNTDDTIQEEISLDDIIQGGTFSENYQNGQRCSLSLTLFNQTGKYTPNINKLWVGTKLRFDAGLEQQDGSTVWCQKGIFVITSTQPSYSAENKTVSISAGDKFAELEGGVGILQDTYEIPAGSKIFPLVKELLGTQRGDGNPIDSQEPYFHPSLIDNVTQVKISKNAGESIGSIMLELANHMSAEVFYNAQGRLCFFPLDAVSDDNDKPILFNYIAEKGHLTELNFSLDYNNIINRIILIGATVNGGVVRAIASNDDTASPLCVQRIGARTTVINESGIKTKIVAEENAKYQLRKQLVLKSTVSLNVPFNPIFGVNNLIMVTDDFYQLIKQYFLIQSISFGLDYNPSMSMSVSNLNNLPFITNYRSGIEREEGDELNYSDLIPYPITVSVTDGSYNAPAYILKGGEASIFLTPNEGHRLPLDSLEEGYITVTSCSYTYNHSTGEIKISNPTGEVRITVICPIIRYIFQISKGSNISRIYYTINGIQSSSTENVDVTIPYGYTYSWYAIVVDPDQYETTYTEMNPCSGTAYSNLFYSAEATVKSYAVAFTEGNYITNAFTSTNASATSGNPSGYAYDYGTRVYYFVQMNNDTFDYVYKCSGTQVSGKIYRLGYIDLNGHNQDLGTISGVTRYGKYTYVTGTKSGLESLSAYRSVSPYGGASYIGELNSGDSIFDGDQIYFNEYSGEQGYDVTTDYGSVLTPLVVDNSKVNPQTRVLTGANYVTVTVHQYTITVNVGSVVISGQTYSSGSYDGDRFVTVENSALGQIIPNVGFLFAPGPESGESGAITITGASLIYDETSGDMTIYNPTSNVVISATCPVAVYTISYNGSHYTHDNVTTRTYFDNQIDINVSPAAGYTLPANISYTGTAGILTWILDVGPEGDDAIIRLYQPTSNLAITITPTAIPYTLTVERGTGVSQVFVSATGDYDDWTGYTTSSVTINNLTIGTHYYVYVETETGYSTEYFDSSHYKTITMGASNQTVTITGTVIEYQISYSGDTTNYSHTGDTIATYIGESDVEISAIGAGYALPIDITVTGASKNYNSSTGAVVISRATDNVVINIPTTYIVSSSITYGTCDNPSRVEDDEDIQCTITPNSGFSLPSALTAVTNVTSYLYDNQSGALEVFGAQGPVEIIATCPAIEYTITMAGSHYTYTGDSVVTVLTSANIIVTVNSGYTLPSSVTVTNAAATWSQGAGELEITNPTGNVVVTINPIANEQILHIDKGSGIDKIYYKIGSAAQYTESNTSVSAIVHTDEWYEWYATAANGYEYTGVTAQAGASGNGTEELPINGSMPANDLDYYPIGTHKLIITLDTGVDTIYYRINQGNYQSSQDTVNLYLPDDATYSIYCAASSTYVTNYDSSHPITGIITSTGGNITVNMTAIKQYTYTVGTKEHLTSFKAKRNSSEYIGASTGEISNNAAIYYGDELYFDTIVTAYGYVGSTIYDGSSSEAMLSVVSNVTGVNYIDIDYDTFSVVSDVIHGDYTGPTSITYLDNFNGAIVPSQYYSIPSSLDSDTGLAEESYNSSTGAITGIVVGDIVIYATCPKTEYSITFNGTHCSKTSGPTTVNHFDGATLVIGSDSSNGYKLPNSITVTNTDYTWTLDQGNNPTTGTLVLSNATGNVTITIDGVLKIYNITGNIIHGTYSGDTVVTHGYNALGEILPSPSAGYDYPVALSGVTNVISHTYDNTTGSIEMNGATGDILITATCPAKQFSITWVGSHYETEDDPSVVYYDSAYEIGVFADTGYTLPSSITVTGASQTWTPGSNYLYIYDVTGNVTITINPTANEQTLDFYLGTGIDKVYYKVGSASSYSYITQDSTVTVHTDEQYWWYATPASYYTYTETSASSPYHGTMGSSGATFEPEATATVYSLTMAGSHYTHNAPSTLTHFDTVNITVSANPSDQYALPDSISVVNATGENTWNRSTGTLTLTNAISDVTVTINPTAIPYDFVINKGTGIDKIYYKYGSQTSYTQSTTSVTITQPAGTSVSWYATAASGYIYTDYPSYDQAWTGTISVGGNTFTPTGTKVYTLTITKDSHISTIYYKTGSEITYHSSVSDVTINNLVVGTTYSVYGAASSGYVTNINSSHKIEGTISSSDVNIDITSIAQYTYTAGSATGVTSFKAYRKTTSYIDASTGQISSGAAIYKDDEIYFYDIVEAKGYDVSNPYTSSAPLEVHENVTGVNCFTITEETYTITGSITHGTYSGDNSITYTGSAAGAINPSAGYSLPASDAVTIAGALVSSYNASTGAISISSPEQNIVITATCPIINYQITMAGSNYTYSGSTTVNVESNATINVSPAVGYTLPTTAPTVSGATVVSWTPNLGESGLDAQLVISSPTGDVTVTINPIVNQYHFVVTKGTGIDEIHYFYGTSGWQTSSSSIDLTLDYNTHIGWYATAETGYIYTEYTFDNYWDGNVAVGGNSFAPVGTHVQYTVHGNITNGELAEEGQTFYYGDEKTVYIIPEGIYQVPKSASDITVSGAQEWEYHVGDGSITFIAGASNVTITATCPLQEYRVYFTPGNYVTSAYTSTDQNATSGNPSGTYYNRTSTVYYFVEKYADDDYYTYSCSGTQISGNKYRLGSVSISTSDVNLGTISGVTRTAKPSMANPVINLTWSDYHTDVLITVTNPSGNPTVTATYEYSYQTSSGGQIGTTGDLGSISPGSSKTINLQEDSEIETGYVTISFYNSSYAPSSTTQTLTRNTITTTVTGGSTSAGSANYIYPQESATVTITANAHRYLPSSISVTNASYTWNQNTGVITLSNQTGDVTISVTCPWLADHEFLVNKGTGIDKIYCRFSNSGSYTEYSSSVSVDLYSDDVYWWYATPQSGYNYSGVSPQSGASGNGTQSNPCHGNMPNADIAYYPVGTAGPSWSQLFATFNYAEAGTALLPDIGFELYDNSINSLDDTFFYIVMVEEIQEAETAYFDYYDKSTYSTLLQDLSEFTYRGSFDLTDYNWIGDELSSGNSYVVIPHLDDQYQGGGYLELYRWVG